MVMSFLPPGLANDTCYGVNHYQSMRPPVSQESRYGALAGFIIVGGAWLFSIPWLYYVRNDPTQFGVRPFWLNALLCVSHFVFVVFTSLNLAIPGFPCWLVLFCVLFGLGGIGIATFVRTYVFVVESQFARIAAKNQLQVDDTATVTSVTPSVAQSASETISSFRTMFGLCLGYIKLEDTSLSSLNRVQNNYLYMLVLCALPVVIEFIVIMAVVPGYAHCTDCALFLEVFISFMLVFVIYVTFSTRLVTVAQRLEFPDSAGLFKETNISLFVSIPFAMGAWILEIIDPADVVFNRVFMFEWFMTLALFSSWAIYVGLQMYYVYRMRQDKRIAMNPRNAREAHGVDFSVDFMRTISEQEKQAFREYATRQFCVENVLFVEDVQSFKRYYHEKGDNWRAAKGLWLYQNYCADGAVMEVNISSTTRNAIAKAFERKIKGVHVSDLVFDEAVQEITNEVLHGMWIGFQAKKTANNIRRAKSLAVVNNSNTITGFKM